MSTYIARLLEDIWSLGAIISDLRRELVGLATVFPASLYFYRGF